MWRSADLFLSLIFLGILSNLADACLLNGPRYRLESDTVRWSLELSRGESCNRGVRFNNVVVNTLMVASAPQTGRVTLQGPGFSYKPANDFQGRDFFSLIVSGTANKVPGISTIEVEVSAFAPPSHSQPAPPSSSGSAISSAPSPPPINNLCGSSSGVAAGGAPTTNLCSTGAASTVTGTGPWYWSCAGSDGGATAQCSTLVPGGLTQIDGGPTYFSKFNSNSAWLNNQILLGGWEEQPQTSAEVGYDVAMGNNIYWHLSGGSVGYGIIRAAGMHIIAPSSRSDTGSETVGWFGTDEPDLNLGPGSGPFNINKGCTTSTRCGYTAAQFYYTGQPSSDGTLPYPIDGRVAYTGFGKGVLQFETPSEAALFLRWSDILAADEYWFTDTNAYGSLWGACQAAPNATACTSGKGFTAAEAQLAANYEANVTRLRSIQTLNGLAKPIVAAVETGCPFTNGKCVTSAQFTAAAWHALIAGARGIIWFQHNFSGPCQDFRAFLDGSNPSSPLYHCQIVPGETLHDLVQAVTAFNIQVGSLNSVLLSPFANGYVTATGTVSVMAKYYNNRFYVFAGSGQPGTPPPTNQSVTFTLAGSPNATATVVNEDRAINVVSGRFIDTFRDANAVHIYQINPGN
jgi:hypothetical protein